MEALRAFYAEGQRDSVRRRAWADLRETCGSALGPKGDILGLVAQYLSAGLREGVVAAAMERALAGFDREGWPPLLETVPEAPDDVVDLLVAGIDGLLVDHFGTSLSARGVRVLDPCAGAGAIVAGIVRRVGPEKLAEDLFANEARLGPYLLAAKRLEPFEGLCFATALALPDRGATPGFDFSGDANAERLRRQRDAEVRVVVADLRHAVGGGGRRVRETYGKAPGPVPAYFRWATDRVREGVAAFVTDGAWVDEPAFDAMRASLERELDLVDHRSETGITYLVRHPSLRRPHGARILYDGRELHPTAAHVWRTEILREEWQGFMPLVGGRSFFVEGFEGVEEGNDALQSSPKAKRALRRPFVKVWRRPLKKGSAWPEGLALVTLDEPFGVVAATAPPDRRVGRAYPFRIGARENVSAWAMARFRAAYGPVTERDAFDYVVALLHHPGYRSRYREDLRRGFPRVPLLSFEDGFGDDAPEVGPGAAYGTGWTPPGFFEEGTVPDFDDPFASPYARADVDEGFLLFSGLGAALVHLQTLYDRVRRDPLERVATEGKIGAMRLSRDRTRLVVSPTLTLEGIPERVFDYRVGRKSALEWVVEGMHARGDFAPDEESVVRLVEQTVAASLEALRLIEIIGDVALP